MRNLSKLVRDAADHSFWRFELERTAEALGVEEWEDIEGAWQVMGDVLDALVVLAFDYRRDSAAFGPVLKEWYDGKRSESLIFGSPVVRELGGYAGGTTADWLTHAVLWNLLDKIESLYNQYDFGTKGRETLSSVEPPKLDSEEAVYAREVVVHLRKAVAKIRHMQKSSSSTKFELEAYRSILTAVGKHFDHMSEVGEPTLEKAA